MALGSRFDLDEMRREAQEAKRKARNRAIASNVTFAVVVLAILVGGKIGWDKWSEKREADRIAAENARIAQERAQAEHRRAAEAKARELAANREKERREREEARERERREREEARERERREREEERIRAEERRREEAEFRAVQQELKSFEDQVVSGIRFSPEDHVCFEYGLGESVDISVDGERWAELSALAQGRQTIDFLEKLRGTTVTNDFSEMRYPDRATFARLLENLDGERFTIVMRLNDTSRAKRLVLVAGNLESGLAQPDGSRILKTGNKVSGWTVPFTYGDKTPVFLLEQSTADRLARDWAKLRRKVRGEAAKLDNKEQFIAERLAAELPEFIRAARLEVVAAPPVPVEEPKDESKKKEQKPRQTFKGLNSDKRSLGGSRRR